jgi:FMN phosphatase YigB (HAD superfamily)
VRPIKAVLFDFSDTLFWTNLVDRVVSVAAKAGLSVDVQAVLALSASVRIAASSPEEVGKGRDLSAEAHRRCWVDLYRPFDELAPTLDPPLSVQLYDAASRGEGFYLFPDSVRVLDALADRGVPLGVVSDIGWDVRRPFVAHQIADRFKVFVASFAFGVEKPDRLLFQAACDVIGVDLEETLMVGDNPERDGGAAHHGLRAYVLPPWSGSGDRGLMAVPAIVDSFAVPSRSAT